MDLRHKYITFFLKHIFSYGRDLFDLPDESGYVEFDAEILQFLPIHAEIKKVMRHLNMKTYEYDGGEIVIYGGERHHGTNWWYDFLDSDDILEFIKGNFDFQMALECEIEGERDSYRTRVEVWNGEITNFYIDMDERDVWIIKDKAWI